MYQGYRIKINGNIIENTMIERGSYSFEKKRRIIREYFDSTGTKHQILSPRETATVTFTLKERNLQEHSVVMKTLEIENNVEVEYWNDKKLKYELGYFKIESYRLEHSNATKGDINYKSTPITLTEY